LLQGSGAVLATDDVDGVHTLRVKVQFGSDGAAADVAPDKPLPVELAPSPFGGLSIYRKVGLSATGESVTSDASRLFGGYLASSATVYVKLYDTASAPTVGTSTPVATFFLPAGVPVAFEQAHGLSFASGIGVAATTNLADSDATSPA